MLPMRRDNPDPPWAQSLSIPTNNFKDRRHIPNLTMVSLPTPSTGFFWLICQCLFLNAPTMYYYHVGATTSLTSVHSRVFVVGDTGCSCRANGHGQPAIVLSGRGGCPRQPTTRDKPAPLLTEEGWELLANCHH